MRIDTLGGMAVTFLVVGAAASLAEKLWPSSRSRGRLTSARVTDWVYWPFSALVTGNLTRMATMGAVGFAAVALGFRGQARAVPGWIDEHTWGIGHLPVIAQLVVTVGLGDLVNYWNHRLRHTRWLWPFHAVHHSPETLDWLSSVRMHPVDDLVDNVGVGLFVMALGARPEVWLATGPFLFFFNAWLHANVSWRLGPLEYVVATPAFHRWHHAAETTETPCNFAGVLPAWDLLFGTFRLPARAPRAFGTNLNVPATLPSQLAFPFRYFLGRR